MTRKSCPKNISQYKLLRIVASNDKSNVPILVSNVAVPLVVAVWPFAIHTVEVSS